MNFISLSRISGKSHLRQVLSMLIPMLSASASLNAEAINFGFKVELTLKATDVLVVEEGEEIDGFVTVISIWKGAIAKGATLLIPDLAKLKKEETRKTGATVGLAPLGSSSAADVAECLPCSAILIFAIRQGDNWKLATGTLEDSIALLHQNSVYNFIQDLSDSHRFTLQKKHGVTSEDLERAVRRIVQADEELKATLQVSDPIRRVKMLAKLLTISPAKEDIFKELGRCGTAAVPVLKLLLDDGKAGYSYKFCLNALAIASPGDAIDYFESTIAPEIALWRKRSRALPEKWWLQRDYEADWIRHERICSLIRMAGELKYAKSRDIISGLAAFSSRNTEDRGGSITTIHQHCKYALGLLEGIR